MTEVNRALASAEIDTFLPQMPTKAQKIRHVAGTAVAGTVLAAGALFHGILGDVASMPTAQESRIADALDTAFDTSGTAVHCKTKEELAAIHPLQPVSKGLERLGFGIPYTSNIWLEEGICQELSLFSRNLPKPPVPNVPRTPFLGNLREVRQLEALAYATHEAVHAIRNHMDESDAECLMVQEVSKVAIALGMTAELASDLQRQTIVDKQKEHEGLPGSYSFDLNRCRDNGPLDLDIASAGEFPHLP